ncbi:MAG TPA: hypothetical protein VHC23_02430 [Jatrophihabitans sp.]|nr:hypothetical protein [Jatrophihabitans sp.]
MTSREQPSAGGPEGRLDNGLRAPAYVPLTDVDANVGQHLLTALGRARIAAYLGPTPQPAEDRRRLFVASDERVDARTIVAAAVRALGQGEPEMAPSADPLQGIDTDAAFEALIADWHVDTIAAVREAERELTREDEDWRARLNEPQATDEVWLDDDHYVPPPPPPLPRLAAPTIIAMAVLALSIIVLGLGGQLGLAGNLSFILGMVGLLLGAGILFTRLRGSRNEEDDDGSAV